MAFTLRYTSHLGYEPPALRPQFLASLDSADWGAHIRFAAEIGMAGVLYPWALGRSSDEIASVRDALADSKLACSCLVSVPFDLVLTPIWTDRSVGNRNRLASQIERSAKLAAVLGSTVLAVLVAADPARDLASQQEDVSANLREMAAIADDHGVTLGIEPMVALPGMLLRSTSATLDVIRMAAHPRVGLIFDSGHSHAMGEDILQSFCLAFEHVCLLQFADQPGRVEPGAGMLDLVSVAAHAVRNGYSGLVDLEHGWRENSREGERAGLARIRAFDEKVRLAARAAPG